MEIAMWAWLFVRLQNMSKLQVKIVNTKFTFLNIRIPLRFKPTTTPPGCRFPGGGSDGYLNGLKESMR
eukprot:UN21217